MTASSPQQQVRLAASADAEPLDIWLSMMRPLPVPEARARRLALEALLAQGGQGACMVAESSLAGTTVVQALLPVTLIHDLAHAGRVAMIADWWCSPADDTSHRDTFAQCVALLVDWCRAHGIRHILAAPTLLPGEAMDPTFVRDASGLWRRDCVPALKSLG